MDEQVTYSAREAIAKLGIPTSTFRLWVRDGRIKKYVPPGYRKGEYDKQEIDTLAAQLQEYKRGLHRAS